jgi:hypothetical protein
LANEISAASILSLYLLTVSGFWPATSSTATAQPGFHAVAEPVAELTLRPLHAVAPQRRHLHGSARQVRWSHCAGIHVEPVANDGDGDQALRQVAAPIVGQQLPRIEWPNPSTRLYSRPSEKVGDRPVPGLFDLEQITADLLRVDVLVAEPHDVLTRGPPAVTCDAASVPTDIPW